MWRWIFWLLGEQGSQSLGESGVVHWGDLVDS